MDDALLDDLSHSVDDLDKDFGALVLGGSFDSHEAFQISVSAEFGNDVDTVGCEHHVLEFDDIGVVELFEDCYFGLDSLA